MAAEPHVPTVQPAPAEPPAPAEQPSPAEPGAATAGAPAGPAGPLAGLLVIEIAGIGPAPYACLLLAELGADVVRIDRPGGGGPLAAPMSGLYRSRPSVAVDLKAEGAAEVVLRLLQDADVIIEGLRPGVMERLGLGPEVALRRNPRLVYGRMTGWGQDGPRAREVGHDITYVALTGALHAIGPADEPALPLNLVADFGGGSLFLVTGVLAALLARQRTGVGQVVDAAMVDGAASLMTMVYAMFADGAWVDARRSNMLDGALPFYRTYRCADGTHVAVGALEPEFFADLVAGLGLAGRDVGGHALPAGQYDAAAHADMGRLFADVFASRPRQAWLEVFAGTDACVAPVLSLAEAPADPHLSARGVFVEVAGSTQPRVAPRFSGTPSRAPTEPRAAGADTIAQLTRLGFREAEIGELLRRGVVRQS